MTEDISQAQWELVKDDLKDIMIESNTFKQIKEKIQDWFEEFEERQVGNY